MQIVIYGAAGIVGRRLIDRLLAENHRVLAYDRNIEQWIDKSSLSQSFQIVKGYLLDRKEVEKSMQGADLVFFVLSGDREPGDISRSGGIKQVIASMNSTGLRRIIVLGDAILLDDETGHPICEQEDFPAERSAYATELMKMWEQLKASGLDWTLVCPVQVTDHPESSAYVTFTDISDAHDHPSVSAGDLSRMMVREMTENKFIRTRIGVAAV